MNEVASRIIGNEENEIRIEIFDMQDSENAFGVFSHTRTQNEGQYGQGSQYFPGALIFWKDKYYIALTANDENQIIVEAVHQMAADIDTKITARGDLPEILDLLPAEELQEDGYLYFHHYIWLNSYYFIASENVLNINPGTPAVIAKYGEKSQRKYLLIIQYPDRMEIQTAFTALKKEIFEDPADTVMMEDNRWSAVVKAGNYLIAVFNAANEKTAIDLMEKVKYNVKSVNP